MNKTTETLLPAGLILLASAFVAGTTLLAKSIGQGHLGPALPPLMISFGRFLFAFLILLCAAAVLRPKISNPNLKLHLARCCSGWAGVSLMFAAAAMIPLSDATAISFLNPVFAMLFAIPFLGERVGKFRWLAATITIFGAIVLLRPSSASLQVGGLVALGAAFILGIELIIIKTLTRAERPLQILILNNGISLCISGCVAMLIWQAPTTPQWLGLAGIGALMLCAQVCYVNAMRMGEVSFVAPFAYSTLIFAALYDYLFFNQIPDRISLIGAAIILSGALLLAEREARAAKRAKLM
ncbi:DMT transporter permease [Amylibacter marinus]|uniref:DMT transporter permease n=1 Tax=Amylibacter marinus TaxID=1475483 RepID=A0ABQ5VUF2_9RHOB|nr:DMT family transporter [Amylibacter marinus]GLQ34900.1 DMT transporter permease [Amylibacter marinus]